MTNRNYFALAAFMLLVITGLPCISIFLPDSVNGELVTIFTIIGGLCSMAGIAFAFAIYRKLGIDETILARKSEVVFRFLGDLQRLYFTIETNDDTLLVSFNRLQSFILLDVYSHHYNDIVTIHKQTINDVRHVTDQANNLFMPTEIAEALRPLDFGIITKPQSELTDLAKVSTNDRSHIWTDHEKHVYKNGEDSFGLPDCKEMTLKEFLTQWDLVVSTTLDWIHSNASEQKLNYPKRIDEADLILARRAMTSAR